jgi:predicted MFS family arabinose efflux permease
MCSPIAIIVGYLAGGWLAETVGWRMTFILMGVPGILLAILVKFTLREPRLKQKTSVAIDPPSFKAVLSTLWRQRTFRFIVTAFCFSYFFSMGIIQWLPTFFIRSHDMETGELGTWLAFAWGVCGLFGAYLGGALTSRYAAGKEAWQMRAVAFAIAFAGLLFIMVYLSSNKYIALALVAAVGFLFTLINGPVFAAIQSLATERIRSVTLALIFLLANLIGFGLGPLTAGILSDLLTPRFGQESLRYALLLLSPGYLLTAYCYWQAGETIEADIRRVETDIELTGGEAPGDKLNALSLNAENTVDFNQP